MLRSVKYHRCKQCPYISSNTSKFIEHMQQHQLNREPAIKPYSAHQHATINKPHMSLYHHLQSPHQQQSPWQLTLKNQPRPTPAPWQRLLQPLPSPSSSSVGYQPMNVRSSPSWPSTSAPPATPYTPVYLRPHSQQPPVHYHHPRPHPPPPPYQQQRSLPASYRPVYYEKPPASSNTWRFPAYKSQCKWRRESSYEVQEVGKSNKSPVEVKVGKEGVKVGKMDDEEEDVEMMEEDDNEKIVIEKIPGILDEEERPKDEEGSDVKNDDASESVASEDGNNSEVSTESGFSRSAVAGGETVLNTRAFKSLTNKDDKAVAKKHVSIGSDGSKFQCKMCREEHSSLHIIITHVRRHLVKEGELRCGVCGYTTTSHRCMVQHRKKHVYKLPKSKKTVEIKPCHVHLTILTFDHIKEFIKNVKTLEKLENDMKHHSLALPPEDKKASSETKNQPLIEEKFPIDYQYQWKLLDCLKPMDSYDFICVVPKCGQRIIPQTREAVLCHLQHHSLNYFVLHSCSFCSYKCDVESSLKAHVVAAHGDMPYKSCSQCPYRSQSEQALEKHIHHHTHIHPGEFSCIYCHYYAETTREVEEHARKVHRVRKKTAFCVKRSELEEKLKKVESINERMERMTCRLCPFYSPSSETLREHNKHHGDNTQPFKCKVCDYYSVSHADIKTHFQLHFTLQPISLLPQGEEIKPVKQKECKLHPDKACSKIFHVLSEREVVPRVSQLKLEDGLLECDHCARRFDERDMLEYMRHEAQHVYTDEEIDEKYAFLVGGC